MIDIVIPFWNNIDITKQCVKSILDTTRGEHYRIILVDDGSTENTQEFFKWCAGYQNIITASFEHRGYVFTVNDGLRLATSEYVMVLNNDTKISDPNWLIKMKGHLLSEVDVGAVGATSNFVAYKQHTSYNDGRTSERADLLMGFCILFKKEVLNKVGLLDERFNDYASDDVDHSIRIREAGYKLLIARDVFVWHKGESTQRTDELWVKNRAEHYKKGSNDVVAKHGKDICDKYLAVKPRILIAVPSWGYIPAKFVISFFSLQKPPQTTVLISERTVIHLARNKMVQTFLQSGAEHLFFLDDDILLQPNTLKRLLGYNKDIVCGLAFRRGEPYQPCAFNYNKDSHLYMPIEPKQGLKEVDGAGSACILIHRRVFEKLTDPWYQFKEVFGHENQLYNWGEFGEDLMFCRKAKEQGFKIYCDTDLIAQHIGYETIIDDRTYQKYKEEETKRKKEAENATAISSQKR